MKHIKTFESFSSNLKDNETVNENILADFGHFLGIDKATRAKIESDLKKLNVNDSKAIDKLLYSVFPEDDIVGIIKKKYLPQASNDEKLEVLKAASKDKSGIGVLAHDGSKLVYKPADKVKWSGPGVDSMSKPSN